MNKDELILNQITLSKYKSQKITTVLKAYPYEMGFDVEILNCIPIDYETERIIFKITRNININKSLKK